MIMNDQWLNGLPLLRHNHVSGTIKDLIITACKSSFGTILFYYYYNVYLFLYYFFFLFFFQIKIWPFVRILFLYFSISFIRGHSLTYGKAFGLSQVTIVGRLRLYFYFLKIKIIKNITNRFRHMMGRPREPR